MATDPDTIAMNPAPPWHTLSHNPEYTQMSDTPTELPVTSPLDDALNALHTICNDPRLSLFTKINQLDIIANRCHALMLTVLLRHQDPTQD